MLSDLLIPIMDELQTAAAIFPRCSEVGREELRWLVAQVEPYEMIVEKLMQEKEEEIEKALHLL